jgi:hypothetical protein
MTTRAIRTAAKVTGTRVATGGGLAGAGDVIRIDVQLGVEVGGQGAAGGQLSRLWLLMTTPLQEIQQNSLPIPKKTMSGYIAIPDTSDHGILSGPAPA